MWFFVWCDLCCAVVFCVCSTDVNQCSISGASFVNCVLRFSACLKQWIILFLGSAMRFKQFSSYISDTARVSAHHNYTLAHKWKIEIKNGFWSIAYMSFYRTISFFLFCLLYSSIDLSLAFSLSKTPSSADAMCAVCTCTKAIDCQYIFWFAVNVTQTENSQFDTINKWKTQKRLFRLQRQQKGNSNQSTAISISCTCSVLFVMKNPKPAW